MKRCACKSGNDARKFQDKMGTPLLDVCLNELNPRGEGTIRMLKACRAFRNDPTGTLTIHGNNGTGKSTALMAITNAVLARNIQAVYMTASDLISWLKEGFGNRFDDHSRLKQISKVTVLCLDEFQMVNWDNDWTARVITDLLNWRYSHNQRERTLGTVIAQDESLVILPRRIRSRIQSGVVVANNDTDIRLIQGVSQ